MVAKLPRRGVRSALRRFLDAEAAGGLVLVAASALALVAANSAWGEAYRHLLHIETGPALSPRLGPMTVHLWINDGLMALFFLLVGLEIKREFATAGWRPGEEAAAVIAAPRVWPCPPSSTSLCGRRARLARGWAIPARPTSPRPRVLALLGPRVPAS